MIEVRFLDTRTPLRLGTDRCLMEEVVESQIYHRREQPETRIVMVMGETLKKRITAPFEVV